MIVYTRYYFDTGHCCAIFQVVGVRCIILLVQMMTAFYFGWLYPENTSNDSNICIFKCKKYYLETILPTLSATLDQPLSLQYIGF